MIKNYNIFLLNEGITLSIEDVIEILEKLESEDNKNQALINKLVNYSDKNGKNVLMNIVQSNNEELVDYILKFDINLEDKNKNGENVLFYCKNTKMFNKFYNLGVDINAKNERTNTNILIHLATRNIFNVQLYQRLIDDGININTPNNSGYNVLVESILNRRIVELLIKNKVYINDDVDYGDGSSIQEHYLTRLFRAIEYTENSKPFIKIFELLFENGMIIQNMKIFISNLYDINNNYFRKKDIVIDFIIPLKKYFTEDMLLLLVNKEKSQYSRDKSVEFFKKLLNLGTYPKLYKDIKKFFISPVEFKQLFGDYMKQHPYLDEAEKYNL